MTKELFFSGPMKEHFCGLPCSTLLSNTLVGKCLFLIRFSSKALLGNMCRFDTFTFWTPTVLGLLLLSGVNIAQVKTPCMLPGAYLKVLPSVSSLEAGQGFNGKTQNCHRSIKICGSED